MEACLNSRRSRYAHDEQYHCCFSPSPSFGHSSPIVIAHPGYARASGAVRDDSTKRMAEAPPGRKSRSTPRHGAKQSTALRRAALSRPPAWHQPSGRAVSSGCAAATSTRAKFADGPGHSHPRWRVSGQLLRRASSTYRHSELAHLASTLCHRNTRTKVVRFHRAPLGKRRNHRPAMRPPRASPTCRHSEHDAHLAPSLCHRILVIAHPHRNLLDTVTSESIHGEA